ncbi:brain-specific homeobox protein homolog [Rhopilema esculentum]|uniref:brain-specific homeobox protein homolog n=1 Tax=Rhopilema esculentum TaxID=499914 RepID=UPI0031D18F73|eukprot:gene2713-925_t
MQRKPFLSIDDILESNPVPSQYYTLNTERQNANRRRFFKQPYRSESNCKLRNVTFVPCHSTCCCGKNPQIYRRNPFLHQQYLNFGNLASQLYFRSHFINQPKKRMRASFSHDQVLALRKVFETKKYLGNTERTELAKQLNMTEQQIKIWFQNRRYKEKKQQKLDELLEDSGAMEVFEDDRFGEGNSAKGYNFDTDNDDYLEIID